MILCLRMKVTLRRALSLWSPVIRTHHTQTSLNPEHREQRGALHRVLRTNDAGGTSLLLLHMDRRAGPDWLHTQITSWSLNNKPDLSPRSLLSSQSKDSFSLGYFRIMWTSRNMEKQTFPGEIVLFTKIMKRFRFAWSLLLFIFSFMHFWDILTLI